MTPPHYSNSQNSIIFFGYVNSYAKIFPIFNPRLKTRQPVLPVKQWQVLGLIEQSFGEFVTYRWLTACEIYELGHRIIVRTTGREQSVVQLLWLFERFWKSNVKVWIFWEAHKTWTNLPLKIWRYWVVTILSGRFFQILWPSQNTWTLKNMNIFACGLNRFIFLKLILIKI